MDLVIYSLPMCVLQILADLTPAPVRSYGWMIQAEIRSFYQVKDFKNVNFSGQDLSLKHTAKRVFELHFVQFSPLAFTSCSPLML